VTARQVLAVAPFPLTLRNFLPTGLARALSDRLNGEVSFLSAYPQERFTDPTGHAFANYGVGSRPGFGGVPEVEGITRLDRALKSIHLTGFALEYPDGSLQNLELSRRRNAQWVIAQAITRLAPRRSSGRRLLRAAYARYRPFRPAVARAFDAARADLLLVASPGHYWLDHFALDEARRRGIPSACIVLSWDNLYSRGPLCRRPDRLLVWSEEMARQAVDVHQLPASAVSVVGPPQFVFYAAPVTPEEEQAMRRRIGLGDGEPYLAYVCGARTSRYDVEDVIAMLAELERGPFAGLRVVVRPHPQGARDTYAELVPRGVLIDHSPDLTAADAAPESLDVPAIRHMAAFLDAARFVVSSWGTTALLEACIFDTPSVQLRWMDAVPHANEAEVAKVRDFQRYIHMRAFDATGARPYCDEPARFNDALCELERRSGDYAERRRAAVTTLVKTPLGGVVDRVVDALASIGDARAVA
jgi:hypothetical protein